MRKMTLFFMILFTGFAVKSYAGSGADTTIIEFTDKGLKKRVTVYATNLKNFEVPKVLNLNNLLRQIGVDSLQRQKAEIRVSEIHDNSDTVFVFSTDGQKIRILARDPVIKSSKDTLSTGQEKEIIIEDKEEEFKGDSPEKSAGKKKFFSRSDFGIYIGLNNFTKDNSQGPDQLYDLRTWPSRYIALSFRKNATLIKGAGADLALSFGPEIAWYNFMFENSNVIKYENGQVSFVKNTVDTKKSKLVMPYLNFPVMLNFGAKKSKFKLGVGGYIGYRIGGYSKVKPNSGDKIIEKSSFGMNKTVYGLTAEIGKKDGITFFFRYDLNELFKSNQINGGDIQAFSAGIRL